MSNTYRWNDHFIFLIPFTNFQFWGNKKIKKFVTLKNIYFSIFIFIFKQENQPSKSQLHKYEENLEMTQFCSHHL